jgi:predicted lipid carrier protein YhbT
MSANFELYFKEFLASKLHQPLLPKLQKLSAIFHIELMAEDRAVWTLTIREGMLDVVTSSPSRSQCGFKLKPEVFAAIVGGTLAPQMAFFKRQVEIEGDLVLGLKLATVLAEFFKRFPWHGAGREK